MNKTSYFSDIHGNEIALRSALADMASRGVERRACLGDIVGYGTRPVECIELVKTHADISIVGNHDFAAIDPVTNAGAMEGLPLESAEWTHRVLTAAASDPLGYLRGLRPTHDDDGRLLIHGSPSNPLEEYLYPESADYPAKMQRVFALIDTWAFCGHTHQPGVFVQHQDDTFSFTPPHELLIKGKFRLGKAKKAIVNVGSIGQPRDGNPNSCYVIFDGTEVSFHRPPYDVEAAIAEYANFPELAAFAPRLRTGG